MHRSPTFTPVASGPRRATRPTTSWPGARGSCTPRSASFISLPPPMSYTPCQKCRSEWHTPACVTLSTTSLPAGTSGARSTHCNGLLFSTMAQAPISVSYSVSFSC